MPDRLALARAVYLDAAQAANAAFAADMAAADKPYEQERLAAASRTRVSRDVLDAWRDAGAAAAARLLAAVGPALAEVDAALAEARANGTIKPLSTEVKRRPANV